MHCATKVAEAQPQSRNWDEYVAQARARARGLGNRGALARDAQGRPTRDALRAMVDGYRKHGFCVVENVIAPAECASIEAEFDELLATQPRHNHPSADEGPIVDRHGRPSRFGGYMSVNNDGVVGIVNHPLMMMDSALACYGHPDIMRAVATINGDDFIPMNEGCFHKAAHKGVPTGWHQDGRTHWDADGQAVARGKTGAEGALTHGLNLSVCITPCTPENGLWVVPGSQHQWRLAPWPGRKRRDDGAALTKGSFPPISEWQPDAVPVTMQPGDIMIVDRSSLHGSYPNQSDSRRVTLIMSFHPRASALGVKTQNVHGEHCRSLSQSTACSSLLLRLPATHLRRRASKDGSARVCVLIIMLGAVQRSGTEGPSILSTPRSTSRRGRA